MKADPDSVAMKGLESASNAVRRATDSLVKAAQENMERNEEEQNSEEADSSDQIVCDVRRRSFIGVEAVELAAGDHLA